MDSFLINTLKTHSRKLTLGLMFTSMLILSACGGGDDTSPEARKAKLNELKAQLIKTQEEILKLESELNLADGGPVGKLIKVSTQPLVPSAFSHYIEVQGKVDSEQNVMVSPKTGGSIVSVLVSKGDNVKKGQLLVQIDDEIIRKSIDEVKTQLDLATTIYNRQKNLWDQKIGTEIQFLSAKANKESLEKRLITLEDQKDMSKVKAPFSGVVDEVIAREGETAIPGMGLVRVVNTANTKIVAEFSESYFTRVKSGDDVILYFPDQQIEAKSKVRVKSSAINAVNRTFSVEVSSPSVKDLVIRPNMIVEVRVKDYVNNTALVVPLNLIQRDETTEFVYVAAKDQDKLTAVKKIITPGLSYKGYTEVKDGLAEGDELVVVGYQNLVNGQVIEVIR